MSAKSKHNGGNLIISFGAVIAIGLTVAIYKILTSNIASTALEILIVVIVSIVGIAALMALSLFGIRINHVRRTYKIESDAKMAALQSLQSADDPEIALAILRGIPRQERKEITNPIRTITSWRVVNPEERAEITDGD